LQRHPFGVVAFFRWSLVLTYSVPAAAARALVPEPLVLDTYEAHEPCALLAIALVQTEGLRPRGLPRIFGRDFFLSGYRVFTRLERPGKQPLRGLRILRSDTDRRSMVALGNLFTHYGYRLARVHVTREDSLLRIGVQTPNQEADLDVEADVSDCSELPEDSPFRSLEDARAFAGPLPYTFDIDQKTGKVLVVRGLRRAWNPRPVRVRRHVSTFLAQAPFASDAPRLANAFFVENVPYAWKPGVLEDRT
jgi:hypothetical protein